MSKTKNVGFILDDRDTDPYGVVKMREELKNKKHNGHKAAEKKNKDGKKK